MPPKSTAAARWRDALRTNPDYVVYVPADDDTPEHDTGPRPDGPWDNGNTHFIVTVTTTGAFLATWTQAGDHFHGVNVRIVTSRSEDRGRTWSRPTVVEAPPDDSGKTPVWSVPVVVPHSGRVWLFYHRNTGPVDFDRGMTGVLSWRVSDDDGVTWGERHDAVIGRGAIDDPDPDMLSSWVPTGWQAPIVNRRGQVICPMTRWASNHYQRQFETVTPEIGFNLRHHEGWFLRFDNVMTVDDPADLVVTTWPDADHGIQVQHPRDPRISCAMEPSIQNLSDGRIVAVMRTMTGWIWYSVSEDYGESWSEAAPLRFQPGGPPIPAPLVALPAAQAPRWTVPAVLPQQRRHRAWGRRTRRRQGAPAGVRERGSRDRQPGRPAAGVRASPRAGRQRVRRPLRDRTRRRHAPLRQLHRLRRRAGALVSRQHDLSAGQAADRGRSRRRLAAALGRRDRAPASGIRAP